MISYYLSLVETEEDKGKLSYIYENFYSYMAYSAETVLDKGHPEIEDIVHNTMLKIIEVLDMIDLSDVKRAKNLCGIIAKNKAIDFLRSKENQTDALEQEQLNEADNDDTPEKILITKETYNAVINALRSLDAKYRDVCMLKFVYGYKEREIASLLDVTPNTVSTRIRRGKQKVREALEKDGINV